MAQDVQTAPSSASPTTPHTESTGKRLGWFLCWAVVFADIGTSVYYVPGILYGQRGIGDLAGLFVTLTLAVFILLAIKYAEVSERFPEGGGVVTVAARGINPWAGAVGGMFILVDYFLTSAISSLSGVQYFQTLVPALNSTALQLVIALTLLVALGVLNWYGIRESAGVSAIIAVAAFISDIAIIAFLAFRVPPSVIGVVFQLMFRTQHLTGVVLLTGFAGAFLAFSGLESISQLSPVMRIPRSRTVTSALIAVVLTVGLTSPLLTIFSTVLLTHPELLRQAHLLAPQTRTISDLENQFISQLAFSVAGRVLEVLTAITASILLIFASNTAIIGAYHVFLALSRMRFFPKAIEWRDPIRHSPLLSIILATGIPMLVLLAVRGDITTLGDMYAFGLLGAFSLTCVSLDLIRRRHRREGLDLIPLGDSEDHHDAKHDHKRLEQALQHGLPDTPPDPKFIPPGFRSLATTGLWPNTKYILGILTTLLVLVAWGVNLVNKPLATVFGGGLTILGVGIAVIHYNYQRRQGQAPVAILQPPLQPIPNSRLVLLIGASKHNLEVARAAIGSADGRTLVFLYIGSRNGQQTLRTFQIYSPYLEDEDAQQLLPKISTLARQANVTAEFIYRVGEVALVPYIWRALRSESVIADAAVLKKLTGILAPESLHFQTIDGVRIGRAVRRVGPLVPVTAGSPALAQRPETVSNDLPTTPNNSNNGSHKNATIANNNSSSANNNGSNGASSRVASGATNASNINSANGASAPTPPPSSPSEPASRAPGSIPGVYSHADHGSPAILSIRQNGASVRPSSTPSPSTAPASTNPPPPSSAITPITPTTPPSTPQPSAPPQSIEPPEPTPQTETSPAINLEDYIWSGSEYLRRDEWERRQEQGPAPTDTP